MTASTQDNSGRRHPEAAADTESSTPAARIRDDLLIDPDELRSFARNHPIRSVSLFGSAARGDATAESDIDLLIEFEPGMTPSLGTLVDLQDELSRLFGGRRIDVATPSILRNTCRRRAIEQEARTLYAA